MQEPIIHEKRERRFVRYKTGARLYDMCQSTFEKLAKDANAVYKVGKLALVNLDVLDKFLETCRM